MTRDKMRSELQIQIIRMEDSIHDFDVGKITFEKAEQISIEAGTAIEKLRIAYFNSIGFRGWSFL